MDSKVLIEKIKSLELLDKKLDLICKEIDQSHDQELKKLYKEYGQDCNYAQIIKIDIIGFLENEIAEAALSNEDNKMSTLLLKEEEVKIIYKEMFEVILSIFPDYSGTNIEFMELYLGAFNIALTDAKKLLAKTIIEENSLRIKEL